MRQPGWCVRVSVTGVPPVVAGGARGGAVPWRCAGCAWCRRRRRGRWWRAAGRGCRAGARRPRSRPRRAAGTARRRAHRAVVLAELRTGAARGCAPGRRWRRSRRPVQRLGQRGDPVRPVGVGLGDAAAVALLSSATRGRANCLDRRRAARLGEEAQRAARPGRRRRAASDVAPGVGEREHLGRAGRGPRRRGRPARAPRRRPSASSASRCRRTAAGVSPSRSASSAAVEGRPPGWTWTTRSRVRLVRVGRRPRWHGSRSTRAAAGRHPGGHARISQHHCGVNRAQRGLNVQPPRREPRHVSLRRRRGRASRRAPRWVPSLTRPSRSVRLAACTCRRARRRGQRPGQAVRAARRGVDGLSLERAPAARSPRARAQRRRARPPRSSAARATGARTAGSVRVLGLDPIRDGRRAAPAGRRDAAGRRRAARRPRRRRCCGTSPRLHAHPLPVPTLLDRLGLGATAAAPRTGGCPAASGSGSPWRWPSSAGPRWCSSTSRPPGSTRRPGTRPGS